MLAAIVKAARSLLVAFGLLAAFGAHAAYQAVLGTGGFCEGVSVSCKVLDTTAEGACARVGRVKLASMDFPDRRMFTSFHLGAGGVVKCLAYKDGLHSEYYGSVSLSTIEGASEPTGLTFYPYWAAGSGGGGGGSNSGSSSLTTTVVLDDGSGLTAADGMELGWLIGSVWLAVAGLLFIGKSIFGWGERDDSHES